MEPFVTATTEAAADVDYDGAIGQDITFTIDGFEVVAHSPTTNQLAMFFANFGDTVGTITSTLDILNFYFDRFDNDARQHLKRRLNDPTDGFNLGHVQAMLMQLLEEWGGRPTTSPQDSPVLRRNAGRKSTAKPQDAPLTRSA